MFLPRYCRSYWTFVVLFLVALLHVDPAARAQEPRPLFVEGYTGKVSYVPGETVNLHVSTSASIFEAEMFRLGGEDKKVWSQRGIKGREYSVPANASSHGCDWPVALEIPVPLDMQSGYYELRLRASDRGGKYVQRNRRHAEGTCFFIVRSAQPGKDTRILLQLSTNTYNAYNNWGGFSLYGFHGAGGNQGHRVSFDRPPSSLYNNWERPFVQWAETHGYVLDFAANNDLEFHPELLSSYKLVLSLGHDEYWSAPMRDHLESFIAEGGNVAFFSGNTCCWQIRNEAKGRASTCWKQNFHSDPVYQARKGNDFLSSLWSHHLVGRPENTLTGVGFLWGGYHRSHGQYMDGSGAYTVHRPEHWVFAGTSLKQKDVFGGKDSIVGYECDGCEMTWKEGLPFPTYQDGTPSSFQILGTAPARWHPDDCQWYDQWENGRAGNAVLGIYARGGTVFTCGSTDWSHGLRGKDPIVEQITRNVLNRLSE